MIFWTLLIHPFFTYLKIEKSLQKKIALKNQKITESTINKIKKIVQLKYICI